MHDKLRLNSIITTLLWVDEPTIRSEVSELIDCVVTNGTLVPKARISFSTELRDWVNNLFNKSKSQLATNENISLDGEKENKKIEYTNYQPERVGKYKIDYQSNQNGKGKIDIYEFWASDITTEGLNREDKPRFRLYFDSTTNTPLHLGVEEKKLQTTLTILNQVCKIFEQTYTVIKTNSDTQLQTELDHSPYVLLTTK